MDILRERVIGVSRRRISASQTIFTERTIVQLIQSFLFVASYELQVGGGDLFTPDLPRFCESEINLPQ